MHLAKAIRGRQCGYCTYLKIFKCLTEWWSAIYLNWTVEDGTREFGWVFANLFRVKELFKVASELERLSVSRILIFLLSSLRSSLHLTEEFYYYHLSLLCFRFAALRPDHIPLADFQIKRPKESIQEPPLNQTTLDYQIPPQIRQQQTMIRPDYQIRPSDQTTTATPDHQITSPPYLTTQHPISTAYPTSWNGTG